MIAITAWPPSWTAVTARRPILHARVTTTPPMAATSAKVTTPDWLMVQPPRWYLTEAGRQMAPVSVVRGLIGTLPEVTEGSGRLGRGHGPLQ